MRCRTCRCDWGVVEGVCGHCELQEKGYISLDAARLALVQVEQKVRADNERLRKAVAHYADDANWINGQEYKTFPGFHGAAVARAALATASSAGETDA